MNRKDKIFVTILFWTVIIMLFFGFFKFDTSIERI